MEDITLCDGEHREVFRRVWNRVMAGHPETGCPVEVTGDLDCEALVRILKEPRNAITKQYKKLFSMDDVELNFTDDALHAVAELAIERNTGARGLRSILEEVMTDIMFEIPSRDDIAAVTITRDAIVNKAAPELTLKNA